MSYIPKPRLPQKTRDEAPTQQAQVFIIDWNKQLRFMGIRETLVTIAKKANSEVSTEVKDRGVKVKDTKL